MRINPLILYYIVLFYFSCNLIMIPSENRIKLMPRETDVPGWRLKAPPQEFTSAKIHEYLKERTDLYQKYGFQKLYTALYNFINDSNRVNRVEIYKMNSSLNAFGIMSIERGFNYKDSPILNNSFITDNSISFSKGKYYIKIITSNYYENAIKYITTFAEIVSDNLKNGDRRLPNYITLFADNNYDFNVVYYIDGIKELLELKNLFLREKIISKEKRIIFFTKRDSYYTSMKEFSNLLKNNDDPFILSNAGELQVAFKKRKNNKLIFTSVYKEWIFGIIKTKSLLEGKTMINQLHKELVDYCNNE